MFRCFATQAMRLASHKAPSLFCESVSPKPMRLLQMCQQARPLCLGMPSPMLNLCDRIPLNGSIGLQPNASQVFLCLREFHAKGSKVRYMDFRYKLRTNHYRSHLLIIRRQKMKKHRRLKWRKKYKSMLAKVRLKREIAKEKTFRVELLTMIQKAEQFNPKEYALNKINEINTRPREPTMEELREELKEKIRVNRYQVTYIKPKHRRIETFQR